MSEGKPSAGEDIGGVVKITCGGWFQPASVYNRSVLIGPPPLALGSVSDTDGMGNRMWAARRDARNELSSQREKILFFGHVLPFWPTRQQGLLEVWLLHVYVLITTILHQDLPSVIMPKIYKVCIKRQHKQQPAPSTLAYASSPSVLASADRWRRNAAISSMSYPSRIALTFCVSLFIVYSQERSPSSLAAVTPVRRLVSVQHRHTSIS